MRSEKVFPITPESESEINRLKKLAEVLGVTFDDGVGAGSQGTSVGIKSRSVLFSHRADSRTFFVQDVRYGPEGELGVLDAPDDQYLKEAHAVLAKLEIPQAEVAEGSIIKEQTQTAEHDLETGRARYEDPRPGKRYALLARQIDGLPVWSSRVLLGLTGQGKIGFLEAHWPEIAKAVIAEARGLEEKIRQGWNPPEKPGTKVTEVRAGIIHSPAVGFVMDVYPAIRVTYASTDERFGKIAAEYVDRHGRPVPVPRQFDLSQEQLERPISGRQSGAKDLDPKRARFREYLLSSSKSLDSLKSDTSYEELGCVGYQPQFRKLETVVYIKRHGGYGGDLCSPGTPEYVRFYLSFDGGASWQDQGITSFTARDFQFDGHRLEYAVSLDIKPVEKFCFTENLPLVRAILSWNAAPPPNTPGYQPHWGNVKEARIQIGALRFPFWHDIFEYAKLELPAPLHDVVNLMQPAELQSTSLSPAELVLHYKGRGVPEHRIRSSEVKKFVDTSQLSAINVSTQVDWAKIIEQLQITQGDTQFEELTCVGLDVNADRLIAIIDVKLANGYSGGLCSAGSQEYVAFWMEYGAGWTYAGTTSVNVHDVVGNPAPGALSYAAFLPVDFSGRRKPCENGPVTARVRAILSWNAAPPATDPNFTPHWGNRLETLVHIIPGASREKHEPFLSSLGDVGETDIDALGFANRPTIHTGLDCSNSPFGGRITIAGHIAFPTPGLKYRIMKKPHGAPDAAYTPLSLDPLPLLVNTWNVITGWSQTTVTVMPDPITGYYPYEDYAWYHSVETSLMGAWYSNVSDDGLTFDFQIHVSTDGNPANDRRSNVVTALIDNRDPSVTLSIDVGAGVQCADFAPGATFTGKYSAIDTHFRAFQFAIEPSGPPNDPPHGVLPTPTSGASVVYAGAIADPGVVAGTFTLNTGLNVGPPPTGPMDACGYALILHVWDRTNVNSGEGNHYNKASVGFCLQTEHQP